VSGIILFVVPWIVLEYRIGPKVVQNTVQKDRRNSNWKLETGNLALKKLKGIQHPASSI
jgi:hypothetical protein